MIRLTDNRGFRWWHSGAISVKGFGFTPEGEWLAGQELADWWAEAVSASFEESVEKLLDKAAQLNGSFVAVMQQQQQVVAVVDKLRAFPLFYSTKGDEFILTDSGQAVIAAFSHPKLNPAGAFEVLHGGFVSGTGTLIQRVQQVEAGHAVVWQAGQPARQVQYFQHFPVTQPMDEPWRPTLRKLTEEVFQRLIRSLEGRQAVIPLSGGYDSRIILCMLRKLGYENLAAYTYGLPDSPEVEIARKTAAQLNVPWRFIPHTKKLFTQLFASEAHQYRHWAGSLASLPHEQDFFAIWQLKQEGWLEPDAVIIPGFCGDLLAGSYIPVQADLKQLQTGREAVVQYILQRLYFKESAQSSPQWQRLEEHLTDQFPEQAAWLEAFQRWVTLNRVAKYTVNALRVYEWFGYQWRMPLWDDPWMSFWYRLPLEARIDRKLYRQFLEEELFGPMQVDFRPKGAEQWMGHQSLATRLRALTPKAVRQLLKRLLVRPEEIDPNGFHLLSSMIQERLEPGTPLERQDVNYAHSAWYLQEVRQLLLKR